MKLTGSFSSKEVTIRRVVILESLITVGEEKLSKTKDFILIK